MYFSRPCISHYKIKLCNQGRVKFNCQATHALQKNLTKEQHFTLFPPIANW